MRRGAGSLSPGGWLARYRHRKPRIYESEAESSTRDTTSPCPRISPAASEEHRHRVALLVRTIPLVAEETSFAFKGGTAIKLFIRDMPRVRVDIDLRRLPVQDRPTSLASIDATMLRMAKRIRARPSRRTCH
jgi:hypothetical protein